jgi:peptidoglycan-associated lipoprotein
MRTPCPEARRAAAFTPILLALPAALLLFAAACAPRPKNVPCGNDGDCEKAGEDLRYCLESRCVECVGNSSCEGGKCIDGQCVIACVNDRGCPRGQACTGGTCERL